MNQKISIDGATIIVASSIIILIFSHLFKELHMSLYAQFKHNHIRTIAVCTQITHTFVNMNYGTSCMIYFCQFPSTAEQERYAPSCIKELRANPNALDILKHIRLYLF